MTEKEIALSAALLAVCLAIFVIALILIDWANANCANKNTQPANNQPAKQNEIRSGARVNLLEHTAETPDETKERHHRDTIAWTRKTARLVAVYTFVTAFIAALSFGQLVIMRGQLNEMKDDSRAWMGSTDALIKTPLQVDKSYNFTVAFNNTGKTPATQFTDEFNLALFTNAEWKDGTATKKMFLSRMPVWRPSRLKKVVSYSPRHNSVPITLTWIL